MKTTSHIGTIDKVLFTLFFTLYVTVVVIASAVLTGCEADTAVLGAAPMEVSSDGNRQDAGELNDATGNDSARSSGTGAGNGTISDTRGTSDINTLLTDGGNSKDNGSRGNNDNGSNSSLDTNGGTRTGGDTDTGSSVNDGGNNLADNGGSDGNNASLADGNNGNDDNENDTDTGDTDTVNGTSIGIDGKIIAAAQDIQSSDIKASVLQDTTITSGDSSSAIKDTSVIKDASTIKDAALLDGKGTVIADTTSSSDTGATQKPDVITITQDVITTVKDVIIDIIKDTSAGIILDIIADNGGQKLDSKGQLDIAVASDTGSTTIKDSSAQTDTKTAADTVAAPDSQAVKDATALQDTQSTKDTQIASDTQLVKDTQAQQDVQTQQDTQTQPTPDVFIVPNNQTTWYLSKEYKYKVQYPTWVQATALKTTDLQLTGNAQNKVGLTKQELAGIAHFTLRTEFEYYPSYMTYDGWWKNLYGKPDEVATYQGQTLKYHSADGGGGFNRYTYVKIGSSGSLRIEMNFSMPPHLYVEGFEQKALEVLYMVTKSAQAAN